MKKTIKDYDLKGKRVIIRCDFNVPTKDGKVQDDTRIRASLPTIQYAISKNAKVILLSHLGRVKEKSDLAKNDLTEVSQILSNLLGQEVLFSPKTRGKELEEMVQNLKEKEVLLIQNTRYEDLIDKKESKNDSQLGAYWASLGDIFINDAFGTTHRSHASNVGIASLLPNGIGFLIEKELEKLEPLNHPMHPFTIILGGAKVSDKIGVIEHLALVADHILIGGGMAFTFLKASGKEVGKSLVDDEHIDFCKEILAKYHDKIVLPLDINASTELNEEKENHITLIEEIKENEMGLDIGDKTILCYQKIIEDSKTIFWNGPVGVYEMKKYQTGTKKLLEIVTNSKAFSVLGGGDIVTCATLFGFKDKVSHLSTGGGATLEYLEGKELPGIKVIEEK